MTFKIVFTIIAFFRLDIDQINNKTAFLYEFINYFVYIKILKSTKTEVN